MADPLPPSADDQDYDLAPVEHAPAFVDPGNDWSALPAPHGVPRITIGAPAPRAVEPPPYDLVPVDQPPQFADGPIPKAGKTIQPVAVGRDIAAMPGKVADTVGDLTGVTDAARALRGEMTPEEAQMFALGALPMLAGGPEAKVAGEAMPLMSRLFADIRPASENLADVVDSNFMHGRVIGDKTVPIDSLSGGTTGDVTDAKRVGKLARQMNGPNGYIERPIVDDAGTVIEGQHRLDALRQLGVDQVPVTVVKDLERGYNTDAMKTAIKQAGVTRSDHVNQLMDHALNAIHDEGTPQAAAANTSIGGQWEQPYQAALAAAPLQPQGIRAYHGSPYDFNAFDLSKIGTGEGAQAYGHGLYFAENPAVAKEYRDALSRPPLTGNDANDLAQFAYSASRGDMQGAIDRLQADVDRYDQKGWPHTDAGMNENYKKQYVEAIQQLKDQNIVRPGKTYEVNINADPEHFLDWDKRQHEQSPYVRDILQREWLGSPTDPNTSAVQSQLDVLLSQKEMTKEDAEKYSALRGQLSTMSPTGAEIYNNMTSKLSSGNSFVPAADMRTDILHKAGIQGIKYKDQGSRDWRILSPDESVSGKWVVGKWPGGGREQKYFDNEKDARDYFDQNSTRNYVVFNPKIIDIVKKYGLAGLVASGAAHFKTQAVDHDPFAGEQQ